VRVDWPLAGGLVGLSALWYAVGVHRSKGQLGWWVGHTQRPGRRQYTVAEVAAADCFRCGSPAEHQWQVCADGNTWRPLCFACDVELNRRTLEWMGHPDQHRLMLDYCSRET
jgi:hypothetical protein